MTRLIITLMLLGLLVGAAVLEHNFIDQSYKRLGNDLDALTATMTAQVDEHKEAGGEAKDAGIDTPENIAKVTAMYDYWKQREKRLEIGRAHV